MGSWDQSKYQKTLTQEINSWKPYHRGMRPGDQQIFTEICSAAKNYMPDSVVEKRLMASEGLFMGLFLNNQLQISNLKKEVKKLKEEISLLIQE